MKYDNIREEELKNKVEKDYFWLFDCTKIIGNVDFCVCLPQSNKGIHPLASSPLAETQSLLWAEAKRGSADIYKSLAQLILTIGKARTFDKYLPPAFLGLFDYEKIAFIPYSDIQDIFYINDFNWNVVPSNYETKEFKLIYEKLVGQDNSPPFMEGWAQSGRGGKEGWTPKADRVFIFNYLKDDAELKRFIKTNFADKKFGLTKIKIDKNNFLSIYNKWLEVVKPTIQEDWEEKKKYNIIDADFYLADLISAENKTLKEKLSILLNTDLYEVNMQIPNINWKLFSRAGFSDNQKAHTQFWAKYERPPLEVYWDYIVDHRHLLVPQDIRERKGSFYTPRIWVELSQKYLADVLGEDWQDEYYVWDCCAGTGNLLAGLTNKYNIWASTLDKADVDVMKDRIENGANLLESHVFQFDFLNDDFSKLPQGLQDIINDEKKRKKLVIYINPPYAEHGNRRTFAGKGEHKSKVSTTSKVYDSFTNIVGTATRELYAQFFLRIYKEIPDAKLASFSTLKFINAQNFLKFRNYFKADFLKGFICKSDTFDNVFGKFPIGFLIWNLEKKESISKIITDIMNNNADLTKCWAEGEKSFFAVNEKIFISDWLRCFYDNKSEVIGYIILPGVDMQQQNGVYITSQPTQSDILQHKTARITQNNLIEMAIYFAVRKCVTPTWLNNRDQFLYPNDGWKTDYEFQNDCLAYTLFHNSNNISSKYGTNHWIPFTEYVAHARDKFKSNLMTDFIIGKIVEAEAREPMLFYADTEIGGGGGGADFKSAQKREFSETAKKVFKAGGDLWRYYHSQKFPSTYGGVDDEGGRGGYNVNASFYDIREHFQERNEKGNMNPTSKDEKYNELIDNLRFALKNLAEKIEPKIYEYGFLIN